MCAACAMAAAAGVSGTRAWLNMHGFSWLTPKRLRALTVRLGIAALSVSSVGLSGSTPAPPPAPRARPQPHHGDAGPPAPGTRQAGHTERGSERRHDQHPRPAVVLAPAPALKRLAHAQAQFEDPPARERHDGDRGHGALLR